MDRYGFGPSYAFWPDEMYGSDGADRVEFQLSTNAGEPLKPISRGIRR